MEEFFRVIKEASDDFTQPLQWVVAINGVSRSGLTRRISFALLNRKKGCLVRMNGYLSDLLEVNVNREGLQVKGCGMDMVFATLFDAIHIIADKIPQEFMAEQSNYVSYMLL